MPNSNTVETLVDGQLAIATIAQSGTIISGRGDETTVALVQTDSGNQLAIKTFELGNGGGGGGSTYTAGDGIDITDNVISVKAPTLTANNLLSGTNIEIIPEPVEDKGIDEHTIGCWHFDTDLNSVVNNSSFTPSGDLGIETSTVKFGAGALGGSQNTLQEAHIFGDFFRSDWTVDLWFRTYAVYEKHKLFWISPYDSFPAYNGTVAFCLNDASGSYPRRLGLEFGNNGTLYRYYFTTASEDIVTGSTWHHIALTHKADGHIFTCYLDGQQYGQPITRSDWNPPDNLNYFRIESGYSDTQFDEYRISNVIRYNGPFTPPTEAYSENIPTGNYVINNTMSVDNSLSDTSTNPVQNKEVTNALQEVGYSTWQKPDEWVDIRATAIPESVYLLVGHSADYSTYPTLSVNCTVSNSGTYDVFVDGIKQATTAGGTATTLNWSTLALTSGYDVTYPANLKTHVVRVSPSSFDNQITSFKHDGSSQCGTLWAHFTTTGRINIASFAYNNAALLPVLEAVTCAGDALAFNQISNAFNGCSSLKEVCVLDFVKGSSQATYFTSSAFKGCTKLKRIHIKNALMNSSYPSGDEIVSGCTSLEEIKLENCRLYFTYDTFRNCSKLKKIPSGILPAITTYECFQNCAALEDFAIDASFQSAMTTLCIGGTSTARVDALKGVTVSPSAPFSAASNQINVSYTGLDRAALVNLFNSLPTVTDSQVCTVTGCTGADDLTASDLAIATGKGWTITR